MSKRQTKIDQLKRQIATEEANLAGLRQKLATLEAEPASSRGAQKPAPPAEDPTAHLWKAALNKSRERSSKQQCRVAWHRIPAADRPTPEHALAALLKWNRCEEWTKDACMFAPGLHRYIERRLWEDPPQVRDPIERYKRPAAPAKPAPAEDEFATDEDMATILGSLTGRRNAPETPLQDPAKSIAKPGHFSHLSAETADRGTVSLRSTLEGLPPETP